MVEQKLNYKKLGLKAGLEVHQQLETQHKLFCNCSTKMQQKDPIVVVKRKQHPVASELGEIDIASQYEYLKDRTFHYQVFANETCLVDLDEAPPINLNREALEIALQIALLLNCEIPNELHVMRKTITDGSNTTAFQRSLIVGMNGFLKYKGKKVEIKQISLEEDAAAIVSEEDGNVIYRLNRLGVPLVEISTGLLQNFSPEEVEDIAFNIGMICRSTGKVKRGSGSIRQDVNVSIAKGARVEVKGVQELGILSKVIEFEVQRQLSIDQIKNELRKKGIRKITAKPVEVTNYLKDSKSKVIQAIIDAGGKIFATGLHKFTGYLKREISGGKSLGRELAEFVSTFGVKGIIHSDEDLIRYQLSDEFKKLREVLNAGEEDAIVIIGERAVEGRISSLFIENINSLLQTLEKETRAANPDATTRFLRPLPGAARMYVETDIVPITVAKDEILKLKKQLPEPWQKRLARFKSKFKLSNELATQILKSEYLELFERIVSAKRVEASIVAGLFTNILKDLQKRENVGIENLTENHFLEIFDYFAKRKIVKEAIPEVLKYLAVNSKDDVETAITKLNLEAISISELKRIVKDILVRQPELPFDKLYGIVMSKVRGKIDAQIVMKIVKKLVK